MHISQPSLFTRDDTFFGVCEGLGEDFGINPLILRLAFTLLLFFNPIAAIGGYVAAGALVAIVRLLIPNPRTAAAAQAAPAPVQDEEEHHRLPLAA
jgi:phage shock protein PspC (stress-responsive transcriptional regulator)